MKNLKLKGLKRGFFAGLKRGADVDPDMRFGCIQAGKLIGLFICFTVKWVYIIAMAALAAKVMAS